MADVYALVREAILTRSRVLATYRGGPRELCPHVLGTKGGRRNALCYQFAGYSERGLGPDGSAANWRCMHIDDLEEVSIQAGPWHTAPDHTRPATCVDEIDVEVIL